MSQKVQLSPAAVGLYRDCPRCFWLDKNRRLARPRGVFPSLPGGMDRILKSHYDVFRAAGTIPQEIVGKVEGHLYPDQAQLNRWRNWRTGLKAETNVAVVVGALDDLLVTPLGHYSPLDYKTRGAAPKDGGSEQYYGHQLDLYSLLLRDNGLPPSGEAHLAYYFPAAVGKENEPGTAHVAFDCDVVTLQVSPERAALLVNEAADCARNTTPPPPAAGCDYCAFARSRRAGHVADAAKADPA